MILTDNTFSSLGNGVFTKIELFQGQKLCEYKGEHISIPEAERRENDSGVKGNFLFFFAYKDVDYW